MDDVTFSMFWSCGRDPKKSMFKTLTQTVPDPDISATLCDLHKATFTVFLRMSSYKESPENFISPSAYGKIIYDNFVFDIAKIMDICTLFFLVRTFKVYPFSIRLFL
jgi:hypothetical protein